LVPYPIVYNHRSFEQRYEIASYLVRHIDTSNGDIKQAVLKSTFQGLAVSGHQWISRRCDTQCEIVRQCLFTVPLTKEVRPFGI